MLARCCPRRAPIGRQVSRDSLWLNSGTNQVRLLICLTGFTYHHHHQCTAPYVKLYLMSDRKCIGKFKTNRSKPSLDPLFQQQFTFRHEYRNAVLQVIVWADYGKRDRKSLMGVAQIQLASLDISSLVVSWYLLFNAPSMACSSHTSSKALRHTI